MVIYIKIIDFIYKSITLFICYLLNIIETILFLDINSSERCVELNLRMQRLQRADRLLLKVNERLTSKNRVLRRNKLAAAARLKVEALSLRSECDRRRLRDLDIEKQRLADEELVAHRRLASDADSRAKLGQLAAIVQRGERHMEDRRRELDDIARTLEGSRDRTRDERVRLDEATTRLRGERKELRHNERTRRKVPALLTLYV